MFLIDDWKMKRAHDDWKMGRRNRNMNSLNITVARQWGDITIGVVSYFFELSEKEMSSHQMDRIDISIGIMLASLGWASP